MADSRLFLKDSITESKVYIYLNLESMDDGFSIYISLNDRYRHYFVKKSFKTTDEFCSSFTVGLLKIIYFLILKGKKIRN